MLTPEEHAELQRLLREHIPLRAIARRLNRDPKTIRRALGRSRSSRAARRTAQTHSAGQRRER